MIAVYPGSFDPITLGHIDIITRLAPQFEKLVILIAEAEHKNYIFSPDERVGLLRECLPKNLNVEVDTFAGLTVDYAAKIGATVMVRGLRGVTDLENEMAMANINRKLKPNIETLIAFASPEYTSVSSRLVKEVARRNGDLQHFVPKPVIESLKSRLTEENSQ